MKCNQSKCENPAAYRFTWPGRDEAGICEAHHKGLFTLAGAIGLPLQLIPLSPSSGCTRCDGCGQIDDGDGAPWSAWASLKPPADLAVRLGIVKPIPCPACAKREKDASSSK